MKLSTIAAAGLLTLCAALPHEASAQGRDAPYQARGTEPFWSLTIDARMMRFDQPEARPVRAAKPRPIVGINGERYVTRAMVVDVTHVPCSDGMSDLRYRDTVRVTIGRRTFSGCGGSTVAQAPSSPILGSYTIARINGRRTWASRPATMTIGAQRISGNTGCNAFSGSYRFERGVLNAGPIASTKMMCAERGANTQEFEILDILGKRLSVSSGRDGTVVLTAPGGRTLTLERERDRPGRR